MLSTLLKKILPITIILVSIQLSILIILGYTNQNIAELTVFDVKTITLNGYTQTFYFLNIKEYLNSIKTSLTNLSWDMFIPKIPSKIPNPNFTDFTTGFKQVVNTLVWVINWLIYITNILLSPTKLLLMPIIFLEAILGINTNNLEVAELISFLYNINIPYIPYWK